MIEIDIDVWKRKEHFLFFHGMDYPQYNICFNLDITGLLKSMKHKRLPFNYTMMYLSTLSANEVEEFRYRIRNSKVILHEMLHPSFTYLDGKSEYFKFVTVDMKDSLKEFVEEVRYKSSRQETFFGLEELSGRDDLIFYTSIPWISFTHLSHTININKDDAIPRISWGKYFEDRDKVLLPYSVQANHAFVDGIHIARYKEKLEVLMERINDL